MIYRFSPASPKRAVTGIAALEAPPAISPLDRTLMLMQLVAYWRRTMAKSASATERTSGSTPAQAAQLAAELAKLMDDIERENVSLAGIKDLVPETYSEHWKKTVDFLKIVTEVVAAISCRQRHHVTRSAAQRFDTRRSRAHREPQIG